MRNETWLEELACELRARGVGATDVAGVVVELKGHLDDSAQSALDSFGAPQAYAAQVSSAIGAADRRPARGPVRVRAHRVAKSYRQRCVLRDVDLEVRAGEVTALIGPNGCGKSTLLRVLAGLERPDRGSVGTEGAIGYLPQRGGLSPYLRPEEHFELFGAARGMPAGAARREGRRLRAAVAMLVAMPLVFYLARHEAVGQSIRSLVFGISWAASTVAFFAAVGAQEVEPRLGLAGWPRRTLIGGRLAGLIAVGGTISAGFFLLVALDRDVDSLGAVGLDFAVTMLVAVAFGTALGGVVRRELEGALAIFFVAGLQATVNPYAAAAKLLPFWSSREIATVSVDGPQSASLAAGVLHAAAVIALCAAVVVVAGRGAPSPTPQRVN